MLKISEIKTKKMTINSTAKDTLENFLRFKCEQSSSKFQLSDILNHYLINFPKKIKLEKANVKKVSITAKLTEEASEILKEISQKNDIPEEYIIEKISEYLATEPAFKRWNSSSKKTKGNEKKANDNDKKIAEKKEENRG